MQSTTGLNRAIAAKEVERTSVVLDDLRRAVPVSGELRVSERAAVS